MQLIDTHAHIHSSDYKLDPAEVLQTAREAGVTRIICPGTSAEDSAAALAFCKNRDNCFPAVGLHPHDSKLEEDELTRIKEMATSEAIVAIGECGLDHHYQYSEKADQERAFRFQIELALERQLPMIFHVREAFADFFRITDEYPGLRGVVHSFSDTHANAQAALERDFYIALNGIMTFSKDLDQLAAARMIPLDRLLLETDCPFLTPVPHRGKVNQPAYVSDIAKFLAELREESIEDLAAATTDNATKLFKLSP